MDNLIFDRSENDLINKTDKAFWQIGDHSRIKEWIEYLADRFSLSITTIAIKSKGDILTSAEKNIILENIETLRNSGHYVDADTPLAPTNLINFVQANDIERILFDLNKWQDSIDSDLRYSGTFYYSGEEFAF